MELSSKNGILLMLMTMDRILYERLVYLVGSLNPCGRILSWSDVQNALTKAQWDECVERLKYKNKLI